MDANRGLFAGLDRGIRFACLDASFYRLEMFQRPSSQTFTASAALLPPEVRVVANGQIFGKQGITDYCFLGPCPVKWEGEVIAKHRALPGVPATMATHRHFGQWDGRGETSFGVAKGDPSAVKSPGAYAEGLGALIPLVEGRIPFGATELKDASGTVVRRASNAVSVWLAFPDTRGKVVYAVHRQTQTILILAQAEGERGLDLATLIGRLVAMGVDDAAMGDGSNSATLLVDRNVECEPGWYKNQSIPDGVSFRLQSLTLSAPTTLVSLPASTDLRFKKAFTATGIAGAVQLTTGSSPLQLDLTSLGSGPGYATPAAFAAALGATLPLRLTGTSSNLAGGVSLSGPKASAKLTLLPAATDSGQLTGPVEFTTPKGIARFTAGWVLGR
jgi:hypothetical protein